MKKLIAVATAVAAMSTVAVAQKGADQRAWMDTIASYDFKHPMEVKCSEFVTAQPAVQEHIVAYLEGRAHGQAELDVIADYQPVSIVSITEQCNEQPDSSVWELVKSSTPYIN